MREHPLSHAQCKPNVVGTSRSLPVLLTSLSGLTGQIGIFGGTFDPVHNGHLAVARVVLAEFALDRIVFFPTKQNPLKSNSPHASDSNRLEMLCCALESEAAMQVSPAQLTGEIDNYTVDLLITLRARSPDAQFFLVLGSDCLSSLDRWKDAEVLLRLATPLVVQRSGCPDATAEILRLRLSPDAKARLLNGILRSSNGPTISSSTIRTEKAQGKDVSAWIPDRIEPLLAVYESESG